MPIMPIINKKMSNDELQLSFLFIDDLPPIPEYESVGRHLLRLTRQQYADEMVHEVRLWCERNPGKSPLPIIVPCWRDYIRYRLEHG